MAVEKSVWVRLAFGAGMALIGVAFVETALFLGFRPLAPVGIPGVGMFVGTALGGPAGFVGGIAVVTLYGVVNFAYFSSRFPEFYSTAFYLWMWITVFAAIVLTILLARPRLLRLASAEAELGARRRYEDALRQSEERMQIIADNIPALVSYIDADQRYHFCNRAYEDWLHMSRKLMVGRTVREVWGAERYAHFKPSMERALRGERVTFDYSVSEAGVERHLLANYVPDLDAGGRVKGFFVMASDVTALTAARDALRKEQARLESALDGSSVALWDTDLRTERVYLSEAWSAIIGAPRGEITTTTDELVGILHPDDVDAVKRASLEAVQGPPADYAVGRRVRTPAGAWRRIISPGP